MKGKRLIYRAIHHHPKTKKRSGFISQFHSSPILHGSAVAASSSTSVPSSGATSFTLDTSVGTCATTANLEQFVAENADIPTVVSTDELSPDTKSKKYAILVCGDTPFEDDNYGDMIQNLLATTSPNETWVRYNCYEGDIPTTKDLKDCDTVILSGSRFDAHDSSIGWIASLYKLMHELYHENDKTRILGICFGAQLLSNVLGGKSGRSPNGWELGVENIEIDRNAWKIIFGDSSPCLSSSIVSNAQFKIDKETTPKLSILQLHRDQITRVPENAIIIAKSKKTPIEMFATTDNRVLAIQGHPEFYPPFLTKLTAYRLENGILDTSTATKCRDTISAFKPDRKTWSNILRKWISHA